uniref:C-type lectin domain-containing protein n=1 Tax=Lates calcarifer TaxID=8187 RepID=A0A4W6ECY6_LATCA
KTSDSETMIKNLTEESDEMKRKNFFAHTDARTAHFKAMIKNLTEEREELKRKLNIFDFLNSTDNYIQQRWVYFKHSFYYISSTTKSWPNSRNDCLQRGADLVIINSKEEQVRFKHWIGLTDRETKGEWKWVDGTPLTKSYWGSGEPNDYEGKTEDCVEIKFHDEENSWNDIPCGDQNFWICEKTVAL